MNAIKKSIKYKNKFTRKPILKNINMTKKHKKLFGMKNKIKINLHKITNIHQIFSTFPMTMIDNLPLERDGNNK